MHSIGTRVSVDGDPHRSGRVTAFTHTSNSDGERVTYGILLDNFPYTINFDGDRVDPELPMPMTFTVVQSKSFDDRSYVARDGHRLGHSERVDTRFPTELATMIASWLNANPGQEMSAED